MNSIALEHLRIMPDIVEELMSGLSEAQARSKKEAAEYSLAELLEYLSHIEAHYFRARLDGMLAGESGFTNYDAGEMFVAGAYSNRDPEDSFGHWQEQRDDNVALLEDLKGDAGQAAILLLPEWAAHDLLVLGRIARCIASSVYEL